jgi:hypothetical protein
MNQDERDQNLNQEVIDGLAVKGPTFDYAESESNNALSAQFYSNCTPIDLSESHPSKSTTALIYC